MNLRSEGSDAPTGEIDLPTYLRVLWRWKLLIAGGTLGALLVAAAVSLSAPRSYEATVVLDVKPSPVVGVDKVAPSVSPEGFAALFRRRALIEEAVRRFDLDKALHGLSVQELLRSISVKSTKGEGPVSVSVALPDPKLAADVANFLAERAIEITGRIAADDARKARDRLAAHLEQAKTALDRADADLAAFKRESNLAAMEAEWWILLSEKERLTKTASALGTEEAATRARVREISAALSEQRPTVVLRRRVLDDLPDRDSVSVPKSGVFRPLEVEEVNRLYEALRHELARLQGALAALKAQREDIARRLEETERSLTEKTVAIESAQARLRVLNMAFDGASESYRRLAGALELTPASILASALDVRISAAAVPAAVGTARGATLKIAGAGVLAAAVFTLAALLLEYRQRVQGIRRGHA